MKVFFSENKVDYASYTFDYAIYCIKENQEELPSIYEKGFLPYTGALDIDADIFYLARSLRVDLDRFEDTSENRRVNRICEELKLSVEVLSMPTFDAKEAHFQAICQAYIAERIGDDNMTAERWAYILSRGVATHIFKVSTAEKPVGYVLTCIEGGILHYWFAIFDTHYMKSHSLGKWLMWRVIRWAKDEGLSKVYLGTAYKTSALYKVRDHKGLAYFDGSGWNSDMKKLKTLCETDLEPKKTDMFKQENDKNQFIQTLPSHVF